MNNKIITDSREKTLIQLDSNIVMVKDSMISIAEQFFDIGYTLSYIKENKLFKLKNYKNFIEFCKVEFDLSKNQSYNLIGIYERFNKEEYKKFNYSQLSEMLTLSDSQLENVDANTSVRKIRDIKKEDKLKDEIVFGEQVSVVDVAPEDIVEEKKLTLKEKLKFAEDRMVLISQEASKQLKDKDMKIQQLENENAEISSKFFDDLKEKDMEIKILNSKNVTLSTINEELKRQILKLAWNQQTRKTTKIKTQRPAANTRLCSLAG